MGIEQSLLVEPHGGVLVDRTVGEDGREGVLARARQVGGIVIDAREAADFELIATGAASPLTGFLGRADYESVLETMRLTSGVVWPLPLTLAVDEEQVARLVRELAAGLFDTSGRLLGLIELSEVYERDPLREARLVYGTEDPSHPGVAYLLGRPRWLVGG